MTQVIQVSKSGVDVFGTSNTQNDYIFDSRYNTFKIVTSGTASYTIGTVDLEYTQTIAHGKSYVPFVFSFVKWSDGYVTPACGKQPTSAAYIYNYQHSIGTTNISLIYRTYSSSNESVVVRYYICEAPSST